MRTPWLLGVTVAGLVVAGTGVGRGQDAPEAGEAKPAEAVDLRPKYEKGQVLRYEFHQTNEATVTVQEQPGESTNALTIGFTWTVDEVKEGGGAAVTQVVDYVRAELKNAMQSVVYDSRGDKAEGPGAEGLKELYAKVIGASYGLELDGRGEIVSVKVPSGVTEAVQGTPLGAAADGGSFFSEAGVKNLLGQVMPARPEGPVAPGATWTRTLDLPAGPIRMGLVVAYTLASATSEGAEVEARIETRIDPAPESPLKVEAKSQSGSAAFRLGKGGILAESTLKQGFELAISVGEQKVEQKVALDARLTTRPAP
jgi:hypothetical protein